MGPQGERGLTGPAGSFANIGVPVRFTDAMRESLLTAEGFQNSTNATVFVNGRIQLLNVVDNCKTAELEIKWNASSPWIRTMHFFLEGIRGTSLGNGMSTSFQFWLPAGGRARIVEDPNPTCDSGSIYLGGVSEFNSNAELNFDWSYIAMP
jgi:hypothetical protein